MPASNPFGAHVNTPTGPAKNSVLKQRDGAILKCLAPFNRDFIAAYRENNPNAIITGRVWFSDNNLDAWQSRSDGVISAVQDVKDLLDYISTAYNEDFEGVNNRIGEYAEVTARSADYIRKATGLKVVGLNFSTGTPYSDCTKGDFTDWNACRLAFDSLDAIGLHEYGAPRLDTAVTKIDGRAYGALVLRYRYVIDWAKREGISLPPIMLSEFGLDAGGQGKGFRYLGVSVKDYCDQLRAMAPLLNEDRANGDLLGAAIYCFGQDGWPTFDLAGEAEAESLLNEEFAMPASEKKAAPPITVPDHSPGWVPVPLRVLYNEWRNTPGNEWTVGTQVERDEFFEHARREGADPALLPAEKKRKESMEELTARYLSVPVANVKAVHAVESNGQPFGSPGKATIRVEYHIIDQHVPDDKREWWSQNFKMDNGVARVWTGEEWVGAHPIDQSVRWENLTLALTIVDDLATDWTSMGLFQILGGHYATFGYDNSRDMLQAFSQSEGAQWRAFEQFVENDGRLHRAIVNSDAAAFSEIYNGARDPYMGRLIDAGWGKG